MKPKCGLKNCDLPHYAKGYCQAHYNQKWSTGKITQQTIYARPNRKKRGYCHVSGCAHKNFAQGVCQAHYLAVRNMQYASPEQRKCDIEECKFIHHSNGLCYHHRTINTRVTSANKLLRKRLGRAYEVKMVINKD